MWKMFCFSEHVGRVGEEEITQTGGQRVAGSVVLENEPLVATEVCSVLQLM